MKTHKDLFSTFAKDYAQFRPSYPQELFRFLASLVDSHGCALDCATGNGQAAFMLTQYFNQVIATDMSKEQLINAIAHDKITYMQAPADQLPIPSTSVDLFTVAQAFHWLDHQAFTEEVTRVAKSGSVLAIWCYHLANITPEVDGIFKHLYSDILLNYWEPERKLVETNYETISLPFSALSTRKFYMRAKWSFDHFIGYLNTWSAVKNYIAKNEENPVDKLTAEFKSAWGDHASHEFSWELSPRVWRI